jgi:hypothetical protein
MIEKNRLKNGTKIRVLQQKPHRNTQQEQKTIKILFRGGC